MLPKHVKNWILYIDGTGYGGRAEKVKLPKLERAMEEWKAGGMGGPVKLDFGLKGLELAFTLGEYSAAILGLWGKQAPDAISARFMAGETDGTSNSAFEISVRGRFESLDPGDAELQKQNKLEVVMPLTYLRINRDGITLIEYDLLSGTESVGGIDLTAALLQSLGAMTTA